MGPWRRLKESLAGGMRQRITLAGFGYSLAIAIVCALAFASGNNLLFLLLALMIAMLLVSGFLSRLSLAGLELDILFPQHIPARRDIPARMKLMNEKSWMPSFSINVRGLPGTAYVSPLYFPLLGGGTAVEESVQVRFAQRGTHARNSFMLYSRFPFGFAERRVQVTPPRDVLVYPSLDPQPSFQGILHHLQGEIEEQVRGRSTDFYRIRPYEARESARHVDWRATAHTGELQVREFTRERDPLVEMYLDLSVPQEHREWFERAVDCCAYLTWELGSRNARVRLRSQDFDVTSPAEGDVYTILKYLALVEPRVGVTVSEPSREESIQVVFSTMPSRFADPGWSRALVVDRDSLEPDTATRSAGAQTGTSP
ncbi:MAG: DUF58 domain-containing protein [Bryobacterales bacterium]|nr:DUF58 domain-containing protein [Bryobacterales bacterium]